MDIIELIVGNFIGFLFALLVALLIYRISQNVIDKKEKNNEKIKQKNFLLLIKDENIFNKEAIRRLRNKDFKMGETATRLKTENKDACWDKLIDFYHANRNLIREISTLYEWYRSINHVLEYQHLSIGNEKDFDDFCFQRKVALARFIKQYDKQIELVEKLIEEELEK